VEDSRLSWAARGILGYLLSRPDNWQIRVTDLSRRGDLSRCSIYKLLRELREFGYVTYHRQRNTNGQYRGGIYNVHETPEPPCTKIPHVATPDVVTPDVAAPDTVKPETLTNTEHNLITSTIYKNNNDSLTTTTHRSGSDTEFIFPKEILKEERAQAANLIKSLSPKLAQQILDEWAGIIAANGIRSSRLGCLRGLINHAKIGEFTPEKGFRIAAARKRQQQACIQEQTRKETLPPPDPNNPIARRINAIAARQQNKNSSK
jgi:DNA-binding transcriptional ArsR family regulator